MSGLVFDTQVILNSAQIKNEIGQDINKAQAPLDALILADSNYFIPKQSGNMEKLSIPATKIGTGELRWPAPYSRAQYYGVNFDHSKQRNPNACAKWFEAAKARWFDKWVRFVNEYIKRG